MKRTLIDILKQVDAIYCKNKDCYEIKQQVIKIIKEKIQDEEKI